jgi:hypothetical protein
MFYTRINKIKVFDNREGFFGLFNSAEMRIVGADLRVCPLPFALDADKIIGSDAFKGLYAAVESALAIRYSGLKTAWNKIDRFKQGKTCEAVRAGENSIYYVDFV